MNFNVFLACFAFLVAASVCDGASDKKDSTSPSVAKYKVKFNKDGKNYEEQIDIDTEKDTETFHVSKTSPNEEAGDIVYDFKRNVTMVRLPVAKSCFWSEGTDDVPKPAELLQLLESQSGVAITKPQTEVILKVVGTLNDRSSLSDEMADLCATLPIYIVVEGKPKSTDLVIPTSKTVVKRNLCRYVCRLVCKWVSKIICSGWKCRTVWNYVCNRVCTWVGSLCG